MKYSYIYLADTEIQVKTSPEELEAIVISLEEMLANNADHPKRYRMTKTLSEIRKTLESFATSLKFESEELTRKYNKKEQ